MLMGIRGRLGGSLPESLQARLERHVYMEPMSGCWLWTGCVDKDGYAVLGKRPNAKQQPWRAHRAAWETHRGSIPDGLCVLHRCDIPSCINPNHLFLGTIADNNKDRALKGRGSKIYPTPKSGEENCNSKLKNHDVRSIRAALKAGATKKGLARKYGVSDTLIRYIAIGRSWGGIE
jgi:hypothetical protein